MFGRIKNRGIGCIYLSMLILALSGAVLSVTPGPASAQTVSDPRLDMAHCLFFFGGTATCTYLVDSYTEPRTVTTIESCSVGWSHRTANQEVLTTTTDRVNSYRYEYWDYKVEPFPISVYVWEYAGSETAIVETPLPNPDVVKGECRPVTGRPPKS